jgi:hypothetical protein
VASGWRLLCQVQLVELARDSLNNGPRHSEVSVNLISDGRPVILTGLMPRAGFPCAMRTPPE